MEGTAVGICVTAGTFSAVLEGANCKNNGGNEAPDRSRDIAAQFEFLQHREREAWGTGNLLCCDSVWAVSMLVDISDSDGLRLLRNPELLRHSKTFDSGGCLVYKKMTPPQP